MRELLGSVTLEMTGIGAERELSRAMKRGVRIMRMSRKSALAMTIRLSTIDFMRLKRLVTSCELGVVKRSGMARLFAHPLGALGIALCLMLVICGAFILQGYVFDTKIEGNETIPTYEILRQLKENGVEKATRKGDIDLGALEKSLRDSFPEIDLVNAYFSGSVLRIDIIEGSPVPQIASDEPSDIVALCDGVIEKITVESGRANAQEHQTVKAGDVLVRGCYTKNETSYRVHSRAKITARVDHTEICGIDERYAAKMRTGRKTLLKYLKIGQIWVKIDGEIPYETYTLSARLAGTIGQNMPLTLKLYDVSCFETERISGEDCGAGATEAKERAYYAALAKLPEDAEITAVKSRVFADDEGKSYAAVTITALQEIGIQAEPLPAEEDDIG